MQPGPGVQPGAGGIHPGPGVQPGAGGVQPGPGVQSGEGGTQPGAGVEQALGIAYHYLNRRESTEAEMRARLERAGIEPPDAEHAIVVLVEQGCLDDARFARLFAQDKRELEQWGADRIRQALLARGVPPELIEDALGEQSGEREIDRALAVLRRRFPAPVGDRRERERALGVLVRKGYGSELALDAIAAHTRAATPGRSGPPDDF